MMTRLNPKPSERGRLTLDDMSLQDREAVEGFQQFIRWAKAPTTSEAPQRYLAQAWYEGLITLDEGKSIETREQPL